MPKAELLLHRKRLFADGAISEMKLWLVLEAVKGSRHWFKYSLYYGKNGERLVAYDNEAGKGNHRHYGGREEAYPFYTPDRLIADFLNDVSRLRESGDEG